MASILVSIQISTGLIIWLANRHMARSTSEVWTGQLLNQMIDITTCPAKAPLSTQFQASQWQLEWILLKYLQNIIRYGYFQMYLIPVSKTHISGTARYWTSGTYWVGKSCKQTATWLLVMACKICKICFLPEQRLCHSFVDQTRLTWPTIWAISMTCCYIGPFVIFELISPGHPTSSSGFEFGASVVPRKVPKVLMKLGIARLKLCCPHSWILRKLVPAWIKIVLRDSTNNVILCWRPQLGIILNKS